MRVKRIISLFLIYLMCLTLLPSNIMQVQASTTYGTSGGVFNYTGGSTKFPGASCVVATLLTWDEYHKLGISSNYYSKAKEKQYYDDSYDRQAYYKYVQTNVERAGGTDNSNKARTSTSIAGDDTAKKNNILKRTIILGKRPSFATKKKITSQRVYFYGRYVKNGRIVNNVKAITNDDDYRDDFKKILTTGIYGPGENSASKSRVDQVRKAYDGLAKTIQKDSSGFSHVLSIFEKGSVVKWNDSDKAKISGDSNKYYLVFFNGVESQYGKNVIIYDAPFVMSQHAPNFKSQAKNPLSFTWTMGPSGATFNEVSNATGFTAGSSGALRFGMLVSQRKIVVGKKQIPLNKSQKSLFSINGKKIGYTKGNVYALCFNDGSLSNDTNVSTFKLNSNNIITTPTEVNLSVVDSFDKSDDGVIAENTIILDTPSQDITTSTIKTDIENKIKAVKIGVTPQYTNVPSSSAYTSGVIYKTPKIASEQAPILTGTLLGALSLNYTSIYGLVEATPITIDAIEEGTESSSSSNSSSYSDGDDVTADDIETDDTDEDPDNDLGSIDDDNDPNGDTIKVDTENYYNLLAKQSDSTYIDYKISKDSITLFTEDKTIPSDIPWYYNYGVDGLSSFSNPYNTSSKYLEALKNVKDYNNVKNDNLVGPYAHGLALVVKDEVKFTSYGTKLLLEETGTDTDKVHWVQSKLGVLKGTNETSSGDKVSKVTFKTNLTGHTSNTYASFEAPENWTWVAIIPQTYDINTVVNDIKGCVADNSETITASVKLTTILNKLKNYASVFHTEDDQLINSINIGASGNSSYNVLFLDIDFPITNVAELTLDSHQLTDLNADINATASGQMNGGNTGYVHVLRPGNVYASARSYPLHLDGACSVGYFQDSNQDESVNYMTMLYDVSYASDKTIDGTAYNFGSSLVAQSIAANAPVDYVKATSTMGANSLGSIFTEDLNGTTLASARKTWTAMRNVNLAHDNQHTNTNNYQMNNSTSNKGNSTLTTAILLTKKLFTDDYTLSPLTKNDAIVGKYIDTAGVEQPIYNKRDVLTKLSFRLENKGIAPTIELNKDVDFANVLHDWIRINSYSAANANNAWQKEGNSIVFKTPSTGSIYYSRVKGYAYHTHPLGVDEDEDGNEDWGNPKYGLYTNWYSNSGWRGVTYVGPGFTLKQKRGSIFITSKAKMYRAGTRNTGGSTATDKKLDYGNTATSTGTVTTSGLFGNFVIRHNTTTDTILNKYYPEYKMLALVPNSGDWKGGVDNTTPYNKSYAIMMGETQRQTYSSSMYFTRIDTGAVTTVADPSGNVDVAYTHTGTIVGDLYSDSATTTGKDASANLPTIYAGSDISLNIKGRDNIRLNMYGYSLDLITKVRDNVMYQDSAKSKSVTYDSIVDTSLDNASKIYSNVYLDWGNYTSGDTTTSSYETNYNLLLNDFDQYLKTMTNSTNYGADIILNLDEGMGKVVQYNNFNTSVGNISYNMSQKSDDLTYNITVQNGAIDTEDLSYKALINQLAIDYGVSYTKAAEIFASSDIVKTIVESLQTSKDADNGSKVIEELNGADKKWYDEYTRTFVIRRFAMENVAFGDIMLTDKLDYEMATDYGNNTNGLNNGRGEANYGVGTWSLNIYLKNLATAGSTTGLNGHGLTGTNLYNLTTVYNPNVADYPTLVGQYDTLRANNTLIGQELAITGADFNIPNASSADETN